MTPALTHKWILRFIFALLLTHTPMILAQEEKHPDEQQDDPWVADVPCRGTEREGRGYINDHLFILCFKFDEKELQPKAGGSPSSTDLRITSYTNRTNKNLTSIEINVYHAEEHPGLIVEPPVALGPERTTGGLSSMREFKSHLSISGQARSDRYPLTVKITSPDGSAEKFDFSLPVLAASADAVSFEKGSQKAVSCWAGSDCTALKFVLLNKLPYKLEIANVSVSSDDLLEDKPAALSNKSLEVGASPTDVSMVLKAKPMTLSRVFSGFGQTTPPTLRIDYKDQYGRNLFSQTDLDLQIKPNLIVLAIFLLLGAVVGTIVRIDLGRLQRAGVITRKQRAIFAATTFGTGILVCLIALFANIKLVVLNDQNYSAWDPKVLFLTALIATVSGIPILYAFLKLPPQKPEQTSPTEAGHEAADTNEGH